MFVLKQGWACLFGGLLLVAIITTKLTGNADWPLHRYDALFLLKRFAFNLNQIKGKPRQSRHSVCCVLHLIR